MMWCPHTRRECDRPCGSVCSRQLRRRLYFSPMPLVDAAKVQARNATLEVEFQAIRAVCEVLETLDPGQRAAVITFVSQRFQRWDVAGDAELPEEVT